MILNRDTQTKKATVEFLSQGWVMEKRPLYLLLSSYAAEANASNQLMLIALATIDDLGDIDGKPQS